MSEDRSRTIMRTEIRSQPRKQIERGNAWDSEPAIRLYAESPHVTALQIRGTLAVPSAPPAYAHAHLSDEDLVWLHDAIAVLCEERYVDMAAVRKKLAKDTKETK